MTGKGLIFLSVMLLHSLAARAQTPVWTQFPNSPSGTTRHDDICFASETHGWTARGRDGIYRTTDGGNTWVKKLTNAATHFRSIGFVSETLGFAGNLGPGSYDANVTDTNLLYRTENGGETWTPVPGINGSGMKGFCALHVLDSQHIFGGGRVRGPAHFVKSVDGGTNWTVVDLTAMGVMGGIMDIYFKDPLHGFVVGMDTNSYSTNCSGPYYGRIAQTTDGGTTWTPVATVGISCSYFWKMSWPSTNVGYVSLQQNGASTAVVFYKTVDGGTTWTSNSVPYSAIGVSTFFVQGIGFLNESEGWLGGASSTSPYLNNFLHTIDGGLTWSPAGYNDSRAINKIRIYPRFAVASGGKLHVYRVPLSIAAHPQSRTNEVNSSATFNVTAYGTAPLSFQWRFNGTNISGANTNFHTIASVQPAHAGNYDVVVSDYTGSITSAVAVLTVQGAVTPPSITTHPSSLAAGLGGTATFSVEAAGSGPLHYQWGFADIEILGATNRFYSRTNVQSSDAGVYSVIVSNAAGSVTSDPATLVVASEPAFYFTDDFESVASPVSVTNAGTVLGYKLLFGASSGAQDFTAIFGFDYSKVNFPTNIGTAPSSRGGTKGLFLAVNKSAPAAAAAINLYPLGISASNDFTLKCDLWLNWTNIGSAAEHALLGINHSGAVTNRVQQNTSDGLFFAINSDGNVSSTATAIRDYSLFRGGGPGVAPILMLTNNSTFGPLPLLGSQFDSADAGFTNLFPTRPMPGYPSTPAGSAGLAWVRAEVRQQHGRITCLLNDTVVAQYTNSFAYTNGTVMIGYNDTFDSIGSTNNFLLVDNIRVEKLFPSPVKLVQVTNSLTQFQFGFPTEPRASYSVVVASNLDSSIWLPYTNFTATGTWKNVTVPAEGAQRYLRVLRP